jgi:N-acetylglucosamine kinase-like BadF-type ATPase
MKALPQPYVVGVDGGSSKTIALVAAADGALLGGGRTGNCCWYSVGKQGAADAIAGAVRQALSQAGATPEQVAYACYCVTGADWPEDAPMLRDEVLRPLRLSADLTVKNDAFAALRAGTAEPYGVAICAGTGTNTAIVTPDGQEYAYGYFADAGSGGDIAQAGIHAVLRADDGRGSPTCLTDLLLGYFGYATLEALLRARLSGDLRPARIHTACPLVFEAAAAGDAVAREIIISQGHELALYATAAIRRFGMQATGFDVVLAGSVFKGHGPLLIDTVTADVLAVAPQARVVRPRCEPAGGAALLALEASGVRVTPLVLDRLCATQPGPEIFSTNMLTEA